MEVTQQQIIRELGVKPEIDPRQEIEARTGFLARRIIDAGVSGLVLGISGGQDSALAGKLSQMAVESVRNEGVDASFHAVLLPYGEQADRQDAELAIKFINPDFVHEFNIKPMVDAFEASFNADNDEPLSDFNKGNAKARARMMAQYAIAGANSLVVVGTDHAAEALMGFFTKFGDGAADVLPLAGLNKRQGKKLLTELGAPEVFMTKAPTADLLDSRPGQPDETELGITYAQIDDFLEGRGVSPEIAEAIIERYTLTNHKRQLPVAFES
jgi:NAD+ synthase